MTGADQAYREDIAYIHDAGFGHIARNAAPVMLRALRQRGFERGLVVELACGSGILSEKLAAKGYDILGIDLSPDMLALARRRVPRGQFRAESLYTVKLPPCVGVAAVGECFNYLFDRRNTRAALARVLRRIRKALVPGGVFLCDAAGPGRVPGGTLKSFWQGEDWAVLVDAHVKSRLLTRRLTTFRKLGKVYRLGREVHRLRLITPAEMTRQLRDCGFRVRVLRGYGKLRFGPGYAAFLAHS